MYVKYVLEIKQLIQIYLLKEMKKMKLQIIILFLIGLKSIIYNIMKKIENLKMIKELMYNYQVRVNYKN